MDEYQTGYVIDDVSATKLVLSSTGTAVEAISVVLLLWSVAPSAQVVERCKSEAVADEFWKLWSVGCSDAVEINTSCCPVVARKRTVYISFGSWAKLPRSKVDSCHEGAHRICR